MITIWNKQTGESQQCEPVDAREILLNSPDLYSDEAPGKAGRSADDEPVVVKTRKARKAAKTSVDPALADLRKQYREKFGKGAGTRWTAEQISEKLAAE